MALISSHRNDTESQERAVRAIAGVLDDQAPKVRSAAGMALSDLGSIAKSAAGDLDRAGGARSVAARARSNGVAQDQPDRVASPRRPNDEPAPRRSVAGVIYGSALHALKTAEGEDALAARFVALLEHPDRQTRRTRSTI